MPLAMSHSINIFSNDIISTGFCDKLYSSYFAVLLNPKSSLILSSGTNVITGPRVDISIIDPRVLKFGLLLMDNLLQYNVLQQY